MPKKLLVMQFMAMFILGYNQVLCQQHRVVEQTIGQVIHMVQVQMDIFKDNQF